MFLVRIEGTGAPAAPVLGRQIRGEAMSQIRSFNDEFALSVTTSRSTGRSAVLAVGDTGAWSGQGRGMAADRRIVFADFHDVSRELLDDVVPHLVLSPILARNFDCVDLAQLLARFRFAGRYRAVGPPLPNPKIITREIRSLVPMLDFDVLSLD